MPISVVVFMVGDSPTEVAYSTIVVVAGDYKSLRREFAKSATLSATAIFRRRQASNVSVADPRHAIESRSAYDLR